MGATLRDIRKRITSVKSTQQITKAMKMVAAARLRKAEMRAKAFRPYAEGIRGTLNSVLARVDLEADIPLTVAATDSGTIVLLVAGNRGLCGGYNSSVLKRAKRFLSEHADDPIRFVTVGKKATEWAKKNKVEVVGSLDSLPEPPEVSQLADLQKMLAQPFLDGEVSRAVVIYNKYRSAMSQTTVEEQMLPFITDDSPDETTSMAESKDGYPFLSDLKEVDLVTKLVTDAFRAEIMKIILDAQAGEHGSRMTAMESATSNASDMVSRLTLVYNRARQASITSELMDIVNGTEALK